MTQEYENLLFKDICARLPYRVEVKVKYCDDYVKSNKTAKQLPDKCVKALDKLFDNLTKEENQKRNDNESK